MPPNTAEQHSTNKNSSASVGITGMGASALTKESLSVAAEKMREIMIEDSKKFPGVIDADGTTLDNISGKSEGVRGDGIKIDGTRVDLDMLCGADNSRCKTNADGSFDLKNGKIQFIAENEQGKPMSLEDFIKTPDGQKMLGASFGSDSFLPTLSGAACPRSERRSLATRHAGPAWSAQNNSQYRCFCSSICRSDGQIKTGAARSAKQANPANDRCARRTHCRD